MGTYRPNRKKSRSIADMFSEAENEHFLDCPTADFFIRCGSTLLDCILCFLITSGIQHLANASYTFVPQLPWLKGASYQTVQQWQYGIYYLTYFAKLLLIYVYFVWTLMAFRGTPAKLLLGLRVVDVESGARLTFFRVLMREVVGKGLGVASCGALFLLPLFRADHRGLHDLLGNSVVKRLHGS